MAKHVKDETSFLKSVLKKTYEYRKLDGSGNNKKFPSYGKTNQPLLRLIDSDYKDGIGEPSNCDAPSPRFISNTVANQEYPIKNKQHSSNIFWLWGQFLDHDITLVDSHNEPLNIPVPTGDPYYDPNSEGNKVIHFNRSEPQPGTGVEGKPRNFLNKLTPFIDASNVYGSTKHRNDYIRLKKDGKLKMSKGGFMAINNGHYENAGHDQLAGIYVGGDVRANEHLGLICIHTLFVREHNYWATKIKEMKPCLSDEEIYQKAKLIVEAEMEAITFNEYLPQLFGKDNSLGCYDGYDHDINPQVSNIFSAACYRLHSLIPSKILKDANLKELFFRPHLLANKYNIGYVFHNFVHRNCEEIDGKIVTDIRNFLFGNPGSGGFDLSALNIQRGRDHGLPTYNKARLALGLARKNNYDEIIDDYDVVEKLNLAYDNIDQVDVFVGGIVESKNKPGSQLGELFYKVIKDQFNRIRKGDRLWYENRLSSCQIKYINNIKLSHIIERNTNLKNLPSNVFVHKCHC